MSKFSKFTQNSTLHWSIIILLAMYQLIRLVVFINVYGGVEHDSGWFLGLARSLAETGRYSTMVSTIADPTPGGHENIYGQYNVQDEQGRVYFFTESGVYGAGIIPNAIIIKLFGLGFWQYRAGPLLFFLAGLLLVSYLLYRFGGLLAVLMNHLFLFFYPNLIIFLGYEAMGEIFSLTYVLLAFVLFMIAIQVKRRHYLWFLACGLAAGLAITTKPIAFLSLGGLVLAWLLLFWKKQSSLKEGLMMAGGWALVPVLWELIQLVSLTAIFDFQTYQSHLAERIDFFSNEGGSGLGIQGPGNFDFFWHKLLIVREISSANDVISFIILLIIFISGPLLIWYHFNDKLQRSVAILLWGGWFTHSLWFVALSKNGWMRHDWYALMLAVFLLSLLVVYAWRMICERPRWPDVIFGSLLAGVLLIGFGQQLNTASLLVSNKLVERWYNEHLATDHTRIPWILIPRQAQQATVDFIARLPSTARIFYPEGHKSAEMAVLTGHILYPIERRHLMPPAEGDIVLIGPSLISPWRKRTEAHISPAERQAFMEEVMKQVTRECPRIVFENNYYIICALD
jgi:hypothetical protein